MAEAIGLASGLITLVTFSIKSSSSLYKTIKDFNSHQRHVRELKGEVEDLTNVLVALRQAISDEIGDFTALELPLSQCSNVCEEFMMVIVKAAKHSSEARTSFRDWARLRYMGDDISGFKDRLASYKSTITIALCDANLRSSTITAKALQEYQQTIADTMSDLEDRLHRVDDQLKASGQSKSAPPIDEPNQESAQIERDTIQRCLDICIKVSAHIDEMQAVAFQEAVAPPDGHHVQVATNSIAATAQNITDEAFQHCKARLETTTTQLRRHLDNAYDRVDALSRQPIDQMHMRKEMDSIKQSLVICTDAAKKASQDRTNLYDDVKLGEDGHQLVVSTVGDLIHARKVSAGNRSAQWLGQMSDLSLQQLSKDRNGVAVKKTQDGGQEQNVENNTGFEQYGQGRNL